MTTSTTDQDLLDGWLQGKQRKGERRRSLDSYVHLGLRFAFYGRMSTSEYQDRYSSRLWQREVCGRLVAGHGAIVSEFFDEGASRRRRWSNRPEAARLLEALADPDCGFDAIVVGEYERAFCGRQFDELVPLLRAGGVQVWLPEVGGRVDLDDGEHRRLMTFLGAQSEREVIRARNRALAAMKAQAELGRYLGGRPPYGYMLVDGGPRPRRADARWGRRARKLAPDPRTAGHVRWMFARRLSGVSMAGIARELNERGVPCPTAADRERNRHRSGMGWSVQSVQTILDNPRYTGRQVWNRVANDRDEVDLRTGRSGQVPNLPQDWAISREVVHTPLVSMRDFTAAQNVRARRPNGDGGERRYVLSGLVVCGVCGRRMDAHWVHGRPGYRCRHGFNSARPRPADGPQSLYWREDRLLEDISVAVASAGFARSAVGAGMVVLLREKAITVVCGHQGIEVVEGLMPALSSRGSALTGDALR
ncbi:recombinase family protein [Saccharothrix australiensis]|uniref:Recombinase-like zinc beta ribbon protein n=1 Tax=Saccharothrix australiensis TaxID=2072 RepID=A0A495W375_9PSEU|nr:recombinase family protein [Saccharothrix australiensis]RKT55550.1 recombinase-like zinc beta ribbon protein [Saccharothrix australiensis]